MKKRWNKNEYVNLETKPYKKRTSNTCSKIFFLNSIELITFETKHRLFFINKGSPNDCNKAIHVTNF